VKLLSSILALAALAGGRAAGHQGPDFRILVTSESGDIITQLAWDGAALPTVPTT